MNLLPPSDGLPIQHLAAVFSDTPNSYKYFFLFSILEIIEQETSYPVREISLTEVQIGMLAGAWYPHRFFKLSFGKQDKIADALDQLQSLPDRRGSYPFPTRLKDAIRNSTYSNRLLRFVPFRLLRPFFRDELKGLPDHKVDSSIRELAKSRFEDTYPFYCFNEDGSKIIIHPIWFQYFKRHSRIIKAFIAWELLQYLQKHNPGSPSLSKKLFPTMNRAAMPFQTDYWREVASRHRITCIYSGVSLEEFALDHFLPWSFLAHNELWNLVPVNPDANLAKSNSLPSRHYFDRFVSMQSDGLRIYKDLASKSKWGQVADTFLTGLHLTEAELLDPATLRRAYEKTYNPLFQMAENHGFAKDWSFS